MAKFKYAFLAGATATCALVLGLIPAGANDFVIKGGQDPNEWAVYGKDYANTRFSPLKSINTEQRRQPEAGLLLPACLAALQ